MFRSTLIVALAAYATAECPSACSGHGSCGAYDQCSCDQNYDGADCSLQTCQFGRSFVDSPLGDLNGDASVSGSATNNAYKNGVIENYPTGGADNSAHAYMECSNKGICDRKSGECECFEGYDGSACQRASCPEDCSGHGTCETIAEIASDDFNNVYTLWDKDSTMGCACDAGYTGPSCATRQCKYGVDPLYTDDSATARVTSVQVGVYNSANTDTDATGTFKLRFYDVFGEDYVTDAIELKPATVYASSVLACSAVTNALEALPNTVIPTGSVTCTAVDKEAAADFSNSNSGFTWDLTFTKNPGYLKEIEIISTRGSEGASAAATVTGTSLVTTVKNLGMDGEFNDYFQTKCEGVELTMVDAGTPALNWLSSLVTGTAAEDKLLKKCLGDSNGDAADNTEVYDWDYGSWTDTDVKMFQNPHAIKLVKKTADSNTDGGHFYLVWYDATDYSAGVACDTCFKVAGKATTTTDFLVYTTDGVASRVFGKAGVDAVLESGEALTAARFTAGSNTIYASVDASCISGATEPCLEKGDHVFIVDGAHGDGASGATTATVATSSTGTGALYTIKKISVELATASTATLEDRYQIVLDKNLPFTAGASTDDGTLGFVNIIKFTPVTSYTYVSACSGRGLCNGEDGLCECFTGYNGDDCASQSVLAM